MPAIIFGSNAGNAAADPVDRDADDLRAVLRPDDFFAGDRAAEDFAAGVDVFLAMACSFVG
jgi:hypothetical protein